MSKTWFPIINDELCTECGACIEKCSHGVYDKNQSHPKVIYPEGCVSQCHGCQELCPSGAIRYFGDVGQAGTGSCCCGSGE